MGKRRLTTEEFIQRAKNIHGDKYDYSLVDYINTSLKVKIICKLHGVFEQIPNKHIIAGHGCPVCARNIKITLEDFIKKSKNIHGDKYDYSLVNFNSIRDHVSALEKVEIVCNKHNQSFFQKPNHHLRGVGCPMCNNSSGECSIQLFLDNNKIEYIHQKRFSDCKNKKTLPFDFYLPKYNTCIEYDGQQHFYPINRFTNKKDNIQRAIQIFQTTKLHDNIKNKYCELKNIKLLRIPYTEKDNISDILNNFLITN